MSRATVVRCTIGAPHTPRFALTRRCRAAESRVTTGLRAWHIACNCYMERRLTRALSHKWSTLHDRQGHPPQPTFHVFCPNAGVSSDMDGVFRLLFRLV